MIVCLGVIPSVWFFCLSVCVTLFFSFFFSLTLSFSFSHKHPSEASTKRQSLSPLIINCIPCLDSQNVSMCISRARPERAKYESELREEQARVNGEERARRHSFECITNQCQYCLCDCLLWSCVRLNVVVSLSQSFEHLLLFSFVSFFSSSLSSYSHSH